MLAGRLLVGSDAPNPFVVPGASLHRELELLVTAGMSPMEVLVAATRGNAEALGLGHDLGTLAPGKLADVVAAGGQSAGGHCQQSTGAAGAPGG